MALTTQDLLDAIGRLDAPAPMFPFEQHITAVRALLDALTLSK